MGKVMFLWGAAEDGQSGTAEGPQFALGGDTWVGEEVSLSTLTKHHIITPSYLPPPPLLPLLSFFSISLSLSLSHLIINQSAAASLIRRSCRT